MYLIKITSLSVLISLLLSLFLLSGCGKYGNPVPPEAVSPQAVEELQVTADTSAVTLKWNAPESDQQGKELKSIDGYRIYRKVMQDKAQLLSDEVPYELVATINDTHLLELEKLREQARLQKKPTRRVKVDSALTQFQHIDRNVQPGKLYAYRLVPFNQGDVEGQVLKIARVLYRGENSEIILIDESQFEDEALIGVE